MFFFIFKSSHTPLCGECVWQISSLAAWSGVCPAALPPPQRRAVWNTIMSVQLFSPLLGGMLTASFKTPDIRSHTQQSCSVSAAAADGDWNWPKLNSSRGGFGRQDSQPIQRLVGEMFLEYSLDGQKKDNWYHSCAVTARQFAQGDFSGMLTMWHCAEAQWII